MSLVSISFWSARTMTVSRNSSTESVFHLSMARVSTTSSSSSSSLMMGSAPLTYLMVRPGYRAGRSLLIKAATCGYAPKRHPHTSRIARSYLVFSSVALPASLLQHFSQPSDRAARSNWRRSAQAEHRSLAELKPRSRQEAVSSSALLTRSSRTSSSPEIAFNNILT